APDGALLGTAQVPATPTGRYVDVPVDVTDPGDTFTLYAVFPGAGERRLNFIEADGKGVSPTSKPKVAVTAPTVDDDLEPGAIQVTADASDAENTITKVEFFVGDTSIGTDTTAPYAVTWNATTQQRYRLTAVATNDKGASSTSRIVEVEVGDLYGDWQTFSNTDATFDRPDTDTWVIDSGGANMWQGTDQYGAVYRPAAAGNEWTATVKIERQGNSNASAKAGLIVRNDITQPGTSPGYAAMTLRAGLGFEWLRDTDGNGQLDASTGASTTSYPAWVRIVRDGNQYHGYWSKDGVNFTRVGDPVTLTGAASPQDIGLAVTAHSTSAKSEVEFSGFSLVDEAIHPDPDPEPEPGPGCDSPDGGSVAPSDEFDGDQLDGCRWNAVVRYNSSKVAMTDGQLRVETQLGDINAGNPVSPRNFILQDLPDGDWTIQTRLTPTMLHRWQLAGFLVYADDDNYVKFDVVATNASGSPTDLRAELVSERDGQFGNGGNRSVDVAEATESGWYDLRLKRTGNSYSAEISDGGVNWTSLGDPVTNDAAMTSFGLMALGPEQTSPVTVAFDYFRVVDTTPPSVSVTVDPAAPNGDDGWYVSPVTVSATGSDDSGRPVRISYRVGDGEWVDYRQPVPVTGDGTHELRFRAVDESGNMSTESVVPLRVDATGPSVKFGGVEDGGSYQLGKELPITASAADPASGVASVVVTLDGKPVNAAVT
ncbi:Ig-like domain-containing protein, partial [Micromonospora azadirachtae]